jgi:putative transposase
MKKRFTEESRRAGMAILREADTGEKSVAEVGRQHGVSEPTIYGWRRKYGGTRQAEVRRVRELEEENVRLKRVLAEHHRELDAVKELLKGK